MEHRLCAPALRGHSARTIDGVGGAFVAPRFARADDLVAAGGRCTQGALFHMQEWKKRWGAAAAGGGGGGYVDPLARTDTFKLTQDGFRRLELPPPAAPS